MRAGKRVARDFFAALDRFQQKRVARGLCDAQIGADGRQQVRGKNVIDGNQVSLFGESAEFGKARLNHGAVMVTLKLVSGRNHDCLASDANLAGFPSVNYPRKGEALLECRLATCFSRAWCVNHRRAVSAIWLGASLLAERAGP